jgi:hypothetical protein
LLKHLSFRRFWRLREVSEFFRQVAEFIAFSLEWRLRQLGLGRDRVQFAASGVSFVSDLGRRC